MAELSNWVKSMGSVRRRSEVGGDCWHAEEHTGYHRPHPATGRVTCWLCHPPVWVDKGELYAAVPASELRAA